MTTHSNLLYIADGVTVPLADLWFTFSRSSGPGGQNVNKVNTRATLHFDLRKCLSLTDDEKARIARRLATRIGSDGILRVTSGKHRTQMANREAATHRLVELLSYALQRVRYRTHTKPTKGSKVRRLKGKRIRSDIKQQRGRVRLDRDS